MKAQGIGQRYIGVSPFVMALMIAGAPAAMGAESDSQSSSTPTLEEVIVTATKREENLQKVPISVSAVSQESITAEGLDNIVALSRVVPGLQTSAVDSGQRNGVNITIRGINNTRVNDSVNDGTGALTTGFYVNDVAMVPADPNLFDVSRVEILKGPQGTLFGQASMGGTVRVILNQPDLTHFSAMSVVSGGSITDGGTSSSVDTMANVPLNDGTLAVRLVGSYRSDGGFITWCPPSLVANQPRGCGGAPVVPDANTKSLWSGRVELLWQPIEQLRVTPSYFVQKIDSNQGDSYDRNLNDGLVQNRYLEETRDVNFSVLSSTEEYTFGSAKLVAVTAYTQRNYTGTQDLTSLVAGIAGLNTNGSIPGVVPFDLNFQSNGYSQEVRLQGDQGFTDAISLDWVVGGTYFREQRYNRIDSQSPTWDSVADNNNFLNGSVATLNDYASYRNEAEFADLTFNFWNASLAAGLRHFTQSQQTRGEASGYIVGPFSDTTGAVSENGNSPRFNFSYKITPSMLAYAGYAEGFRLGGPSGSTPDIGEPNCVNALHLAGVSNGPFKSDTVKNFEVGMKTEFRDNQSRINAALFRIYWNDLQQALQLSQYNPDCGAVLTTNAGDARSQGVELETTNVFNNGASLGGTFAYTDAKITDAPPGTPYPVGSPIGGVAKIQASAYASIKQPLPRGGLDGVARIDWSYRSSMLGPIYDKTDDPFDYNYSYSNVNLRFGVERSFWTAYLYIDNALNKIEDLGANSLPGEGYTNRVEIAPPRTIGIRLSARME
jgi:iron complex outermembrane recepter protein